MDVDDQVQMVLRGNGDGKHLIKAPTGIFPIALDVDEDGFAVIGYCPKCQKVRMASCSIKRLTKFVDDELGKEDDDET